jgi:hypothetical protein
MDSIGAGGDGDVGAGVDEEPGRGVRGTGAEGCEDVAGKRGEGGGGEIFFAELEEVDAIGGETRSLVEERGLAGGFGLLPGFGGEADAVGDGVAEHGI